MTLARVLAAVRRVYNSLGRGSFLQTQLLNELLRVASEHDFKGVL